MNNFAVKMNLVAVVRVRAADENVARKVVPSVLGAPSTEEIRLANESNAVFFTDAIITKVDFCVEEGSITPVETDGASVAPEPAARSPRPRASRRK